jgi:hypothetical protein
VTGETDATLFLGLFRFGCLLHKRFYPLEFLLESAREIVGPVLKQDDEAKRKEDKQGQPKQAAKQRHCPDRRAAKVPGQRARSAQSSH